MEEWIGRWTFAFLGVFQAALGIPMALGKVPPNWFYGFRTPKTLSSPDIWYPANRSAGIDLTITGILMAFGAGVIGFVCRDLLVAVVANLAIMMIALAVVTARAFARLRQL